MAITVPVVGTDITVSGFGKPVADQVNLNTTAIAAAGTGAWQVPTLTNSWVSLDPAQYGTVAYRKVGDHSLQFRGYPNGGAGNTVIFTLPVGYRPAYRQIVAASGYTTLRVIVEVSIYADGRIVPDITSGFGFVFTVPLG